jgi:predicted ABC-type ATPase
LTVVAGPNGSGKSTVTSQLRLHDRMPVLDPDAIARIANASDPSRAAIAAGREVLSQWRQFIELRVSFAIETTLAGIGPIERIRQARIAGYGVRVYYVAIDTPELNVERVRRRVLQGGHGIPERDIRRRYDRSLTNAPVVLTTRRSGVGIGQLLSPDHDSRRDRIRDYFVASSERAHVGREDSCRHWGLSSPSSAPRAPCRFG